MTPLMTDAEAEPPTRGGAPRELRKLNTLSKQFITLPLTPQHSNYK
jgi:hypothetical protein